MDLLKQIRKELKEGGNEEFRTSSMRFFKESTQHHGWRNADVKKLSALKFREMKMKDKKVIFSLCEGLWKSGYMEEALIACDWSYRLRKEYSLNDMKTFDHWIGNYVSNWATCDTFCCGSIGEYLKKFPGELNILKKWAKSSNRWYRRAAAVSLIVPARKGYFFDESIKIATLLLEDTDDLVQKGYGWLLKTQSETHMKEVFDFVMRNKNKLPRTALRYAIEKMPAEWKKKVMQK